MKSTLIYIHIYIVNARTHIDFNVSKSVQCENKILLQFNEKCHCECARECAMCEKIIARTSFLIKKYAWLVSNVRERCKEERAVKICGRFDGAASWKGSKCAAIGRFRLNHSWHFRMTFPREFSRTLNLVNRLIWPSLHTLVFSSCDSHTQCGN